MRRGLNDTVFVGQSTDFENVSVCVVLNPDIPNNHLMDLLQQHLVNNSRTAAGSDLRLKVITAADTPILLLSGSFS